MGQNNPKKMKKINNESISAQEQANLMHISLFPFRLFIFLFARDLLLFALSVTPATVVLALRSPLSFASVALCSQNLWIFMRGAMRRCNEKIKITKTTSDERAMKAELNDDSFHFGIFGFLFAAWCGVSSLAIVARLRSFGLAVWLLPLVGGHVEWPHNASITIINSDLIQI